MASSLLLDVEAWDVCLDARGNWALASNPYAIVQNVSCSCRLILTEAIYDQSRGVPYWTDIFGSTFSLELLKNDFEAAALLVDDVETAVVYVTAFTGRTLTGQVQVTTPYGPLYASL